MSKVRRKKIHTDSKTRSLFTAAIQDRNYNEVKPFIQNSRVDINQMFYVDGRRSIHTPLTYSLKHQAIENDFIDFLIKHGADVNKGSVDVPLDQKSMEMRCKMTPLHWSMKLPVETRLSVGKKLIDAGADVNHTTGQLMMQEEEGFSMDYRSHFTPLHCALNENPNNCKDLICMLLEKGADINTNFDEYLSFFHFALQKGGVCLEDMIKYGCFVPQFSPVTDLLQLNDEQALKLLLLSGYDLQHDERGKQELWKTDSGNQTGKQMCLNWLCTPVPLLNLCRIQIRRTLGRRVKPSLFFQLPLPASLQKYLSLEAVGLM